MGPAVIKAGSRRALAVSVRTPALIKTITVQDQTNPRALAAGSTRFTTVSLLPPPGEFSRTAAAWLAVAFVATTLLWSHAMMAAGVTMMLFGAWCLASGAWQWKTRDNPAALINLAFAVFALGSAGISRANGDATGELEQYLPFLGAGLLAVGLRVASPSPFSIGAAFSVAAFLGAIAGIAQVAGAGEMHRASLLSHSTRFGTMGAFAAVLCAGFLAWPEAAGTKVRRAVLSAGMVSGITVVLLSGSKGSWLVLGIVMPAALIVLIRRSGRKTAFIWPAALVAVLAAAVLVPNSPVIPRIKEVLREGDRLRIAYFLEATHLAAAHPWLGAGRETLKTRLNEVSLSVRRGTPLAEPPNDAHNEFLDVLATRGSAGLALLVLCYATPCAVLVHLLRSDTRCRGAAATGLLFLACIASSGLTDVQLAVNAHRMTFLFVILYCVTQATEHISREDAT